MRWTSSALCGAVLLAQVVIAFPVLFDRWTIGERGVVNIITASATGKRPQATSLTFSPTSSSTQLLPSSSLSNNSSEPSDRVVAAFAVPSSSQSPDSNDPGPVVAVDTQDDTNGQDKEGWVSAHNSHRKKYKVKDLNWDYDLSKKAERNAKLCNQKHSNAGENIAWVFPGTLEAKGTVDMWMSEAPLYDWGRPRYDELWGHFSQVVWKNTARVGCFVASCGTGSQATCEYDPVGNYINDFAANVLPA